MERIAKQWQNATVLGIITVAKKEGINVYMHKWARSPRKHYLIE